jgi:hypothetical protein
MVAHQIHGEQFRSYPPEAKQIATSNIPLLQQLPLAFLPLLLREIIVYDWKFPAERDEIDRQFRYLESLTADQLSSAMSAFANVKLSPELEAMDWIGAPSRFSERLSAYLWATHQIDDFSRAAEDYIKAFNTAVPEAAAPAPRLGIAVIGQEISQTGYPLFRKLRPHGVYFSHVDSASSYKLLLDTVAARTRAHPTPYAHWCIDGGLAATLENNQVAANLRIPGRSGSPAYTSCGNQPVRGGDESSHRRSRPEPFRYQHTYRRLGDADLQHYVCAMDRPGGAPPGPAAYGTGEVCTTANGGIRR